MLVWNDLRRSLHEHGTLDLPAMLEYVVSTTGRGSVLYGGHSMGGTAGLITMAMRPEHARLIRANFFLGPVAFLAQHRSAPLALLHSLENVTRVHWKQAGNCLLHRTTSRVGIRTKLYDKV